MANTSLSNAKSKKNDEFYTQLIDIQTEMSHYTDKFKGKVVLCNCDNPFESNFVKYFLMNFNRLGLKELIATGYKSSFVVSSKIKVPNMPYVLRVKNTTKYLIGTQKDLDDGGVNRFLETEWNKVMTMAVGNKVINKKLYYEAGDFRSNMSIALLKESDIVVTNPPFSLFREYISQLIEYKKQFIVIGNLNAIQNKDFFPYILKGKVWMGATCFTGGATYFIAPKELYDAKKMSNPKNAYIKDDKLYWRVNGVRWYTNIDHAKLHKILPIDLDYRFNNNQNMYIKYANYDAINVDKVKQIPCNYKGFMGVPISFMDKYCVDQFEIIGLGIGTLGKELGITPMPKEIDSILKGHSSVWRMYYIKNDKPIVPYGRIIIRFKDVYIESHPEQFN